MYPRIEVKLTSWQRQRLQQIRRRWNEHRMASLKDAPCSGRPPRINGIRHQGLKDAPRRGPLAYGHVFTTWSIARLNAHLQRVVREAAGAACARPLLPLSRCASRRLFADRG